MPENSLKVQAKQGFIWNTIDRFGTQGVQFVFGIILARLLSPIDYGIIAMPLIFLAIAQVFVDSGVANALIRKKNVTEEDLCTAFYFNMIVGITCYTLLFLFSPFIADFYNTPVLSKLLKCTALVTVLNPLCTVQQTLLTKNMNFRIQAKMALSAAIISGIVGVWMAYSGYGVWSLVFQQIGASILRTIMLWGTSKWRPKKGWSKESFLYLWNYGSKMLATGLMDQIYNNIYPIIIGKYYNAKSLGFYSRAQHFAELPSSNITGIIQRVTFPILSKIQDDEERFSANYRKLMVFSAFIVFPVMVGLASIASPMVDIVLGVKWHNTVILLQVICFARMWFPVHVLNLNLLQVKGRTELFFNIEVVKKIIGICVLFFTVPRGVIWMCYGQVFVSVINLFINTYYTGKLIKVGFIVQIKDIFPIFLISISMFAIINFLYLFISNVYYQLVLGILLGFIVYFTFSLVFIKPLVLDILSFLPTKVKMMIHV